MDNSVHQQTVQLKMLISDAFQEFYYRYKKDRIYAFVVEVDEHFDIKSFMVSTEFSIFNETENKQQYLLEQDKWDIDKWKFKKRHNDEIILNTPFTDFDHNNLISQIYAATFPDQNLDEKFKWLLEGYQQGIDFTSKIYNLDHNNILFLLVSKTNHDLLVETASQLNPASSLLFECLANTKIAGKSNPLKFSKLSQADKDLLIDLAQVVNNAEPYDPLLVAHHAYLLTLDVEFQEANLHIQDLIRHISAIDNYEFALSKEDILERINYFYKV